MSRASRNRRRSPPRKRGRRRTDFGMRMVYAELAATPFAQAIYHVAALCAALASRDFIGAWFHRNEARVWTDVLVKQSTPVPAEHFPEAAP